MRDALARRTGAFCLGDTLDHHGSHSVILGPMRHAIRILPDVLVPALRAEVFEPSMLDALLPKLALMGDDLHWWATALAAARPAIQTP